MSSNPRLPPIDNREALRRTVQEFPASTSPNVYILQLATAADEAPPWWSPRRDSYLDKFWPTEPYLAGAVYDVTARNASFRYELTGPERKVLDNLVQDEDFKLIDTPYSLPIGLAHLDAHRVVRTGDPMFPVIYTDVFG